MAQIDFATLECIPDSFVTDDLRDREDDIIWRVRWGERWLYLYLIVEFQSTFRLEFSPTPQDFRAVWDRLFEWISHPTQDQLRRAFIAWANRIGLRRHLPDLNVGKLHDAKEISTMLANRTTDWTQQWKQEGLQQGRQEGRQEGESRMLHRQLVRRFGPTLPSWAEQRLAQATTDQLEAWGDAFVDAGSLEQVFGEQQGRVMTMVLGRGRTAAFDLA